MAASGLSDGSRGHSILESKGLTSFGRLPRGRALEGCLRAEDLAPPAGQTQKSVHAYSCIDINEHARIPLTALRGE